MKKHFFSSLLLALLLVPYGASARIFTFGTPVQFHASNPQSSAVTRIDATHVLIVYGDSIVNKGYARIATISGTSVSLGSAYEYSASYAAMTNVTMLDDTHAVIVYNDYNNDRTATALIATIADGALSFGSPVSVATNTDNGVGYGYGIATLDATHFVLSYKTSIEGDREMDEEDQHTGYVVIGSVSGTSITMGSATTFMEDNPGAMSVAALDATHFVLANSGQSQVQAGSVSGLSITLGSAVSIDSGSPFLGKIDATHFLLNTTVDPDRARIGVVSGTSISLGTSVSYASTSTSYGATVVLDPTHGVVIYKDHAVSVTMNGTTVTAGTDTSYDSNTGLTFASALSAGTFVIGYTGSDNTGYVIVGADLTAPSPVSGLTASANGADALLSWTNPTDDDFASVTIRRSTTSYPTGITDGTSVTSGLTGTSWTDGGLANGTHYFSVFAIDAAGNVSTAANATVTTAATNETPRQSNGGSRGGSTQKIREALSLRSKDAPTHPAAPQANPSVSPLQVRTCTRVLRLFSGNATMMNRVNERLQKRFGFTCEG